MPNFGVASLVLVGSGVLLLVGSVTVVTFC
jgi:hypothetical protein